MSNGIFEPLSVLVARRARPPTTSDTPIRQGLEKHPDAENNSRDSLEAMSKLWTDAAWEISEYYD